MAPETSCFNSGDCTYMPRALVLGLADAPVDRSTTVAHRASLCPDVQVGDEKVVTSTVGIAARDPRLHLQQADLFACGSIRDGVGLPRVPPHLALFILSKLENVTLHGFFRLEGVEESRD